MYVWTGSKLTWIVIEVGKCLVNMVRKYMAITQFNAIHDLEPIQGLAFKGEFRMTILTVYSRQPINPSPGSCSAGINPTLTHLKPPKCDIEILQVSSCVLFE